MEEFSGLLLATAVTVWGSKDSVAVLAAKDSLHLSIRVLPTASRLPNCLRAKSSEITTEFGLPKQASGFPWINGKENMEKKLGSERNRSWEKTSVPVF